MDFDFSALLGGGDATATDAGLDLSSVTGVLGDVFGFFRTIIDFLKGILKPLFESLLDSVVAGKE